MSTAALSLGDVLRRASEHLGKTSETGRLDAELLLAHTLGRHRIELYTDFDRPLSSEELDAYRELVARRARHEPVAYILGEWGFRRLMLNVDRRALIPRPETEIVVVIDDSAHVDLELIEDEEDDVAEWILLGDDPAIDEHKRDELVETFETRRARSTAREDPDEDEPDDEDELEPDPDEY